MRERPIDGYLYRKRTPRHSTEQVAGHDARDATVRLNRLRSPFSDVEWLRIDGNLCWRRIRHGLCDATAMIPWSTTISEIHAESCILE